MIVGFTGTRDGMTEQQLVAVTRELRRLGVEEVQHGCCKGADAQVHALALSLGWRIYGRPGPVTQWSAQLEGFTWLAKPRPFAERNREIVKWSEVLVAAPRGYDLGIGGTGMTVSFARAAGKRVIVVLPDGRVT